MLVISDLDLVTADGDQAFNVERILLKIRDSCGFEDDDFAASGLTEVVGHAVDEEMIAGDDFEFKDVFAFLESMSGFDPGMVEHEVIGLNAGAGWQIGGWEPDIVPVVADSESLFFNERQDLSWGLDGLQFAFFDGCHMVIGGSVEPGIDEFGDAGRDGKAGLFFEVIASDSV